MKLKKTILVLLGISIILAGCGSGKEGVVATVDGVDIDQEKYDFYYYMQRQQMTAFSGEEALDQGQEYDEFGRTFGEVLRTNLLDSLIKNQVIINAAKEEGIDVEDQVEEQLNLQKEASGEDYFNELLDQMGLTEDQYKELIRDNLLVNEYATNKIEQMEVSEEELVEYYEENKEAFEQVNARHILVDTEEEAQNVISRLEEGEDFSDLARELSNDPGSAEAGGELGFFTRGTMVPEFEEFAFSAEEGQVSEPIETSYGYHIIEVVEKNNSLEDSKDQVEEQVKLEKYDDHVDQMVKKAKVKKHYDPEKEPQSIIDRIEAEKQEQEAGQDQAPVEDQTLQDEAPDEEEVSNEGEAPVEEETEESDGN